MLNKVMLIGNLGGDPEFRTVGNDATPCAQFSVATTRRVKKPDGTTADETEWHRVVFFRRQAEICRDYLSKGRQVYIEGRLKTRKWTDKSGVERYTTEIFGETMKLLGRRDDQQGAQSQGGYGGYAQQQNTAQPQHSYQQQSRQASATTYDDGDVPF